MVQNFFSTALHSSQDVVRQSPIGVNIILYLLVVQVLAIDIFDAIGILDSVNKSSPLRLFSGW